MATDRDREILALNQKLLQAALHGDWATYADLCCPSVSCFEAESNGQLVEGLEFHRFYFPSQPTASQNQVTMSRPHVRWLNDDAAVLSYVRLVQRLTDGQPVTQSCLETRVWQRLNNHWKLVHMHRS
jgi:hypothetical protein